MSIIFKKNQLMFLLMVAMFMLALFQPNFAFAQEGDLNNSPISRGLCNVFELAGGNIGKAIAIFAIVAVGFGFFTGKFSIALVIGITLGIGILFGAPKIISALTGTNAVDCNTINASDATVCPGNISFSGSAISMVNINANTKSFTLQSNGMDLATISCNTYSTDSTDIRPQLTPLTSSSTTRTATVAGFAGSNANSGLSIANNSSVFLTNAKMAADITFTVPATGFCPGINAPLVLGTASGCNGSDKLIVASSSGLAATGALCVAAADAAGLGTTSTNTSSNVTHLGTFLATHAGGNLVIKPGFLGDERVFNLSGARNMMATCTSGAWNFTTTTNIAANTATSSNAAAVIAPATSVNITFTP